MAERDEKWRMHECVSQVEFSPFINWSERWICSSIMAQYNEEDIKQIWEYFNENIFVFFVNSTL